MALSSTFVLTVDGLSQEIYEEVADNMWPDNEFGNDNYYYSWSTKYSWSNDDVAYPHLARYLADAGVEECLIHFSW